MAITILIIMGVISLMWFVSMQLIALKEYFINKGYCKGLRAADILNDGLLVLLPYVRSSFDGGYSISIALQNGCSYYQCAGTLNRLLLQVHADAEKNEYLYNHIDKLYDSTAEAAEVKKLLR